MIEAQQAPLESFIAKLPRIDGVLRIITRDAPLSVLFTFRGDPEARVLLDLSHRPSRVTIGDEAKGGHVKVTIRRRVMHRVFLGDLTASQALTRREMLLRGSAYHISRFIPLFDLAIPLYRDHIRREDRLETVETDMSQTPIPLPWTKELEKGVHLAAYGMGYSLGLLRYRWLKQLDLFDVLEAVSKGLDDASPHKRPSSERGDDSSRS